MNRPLKRLLALAGSIFIGLVGAVAFATPAQAHHTVITGSATCEADGQYKITWIVKSVADHGRSAKVIDFWADPDTALDGLVVNQVIPSGGSAEAIQLVPGDKVSANLTVHAKWYSNNPPYEEKADSTNSGQAEGMTGDCVPKPDCVEASNAEYEHTFTGPDDQLYKNSATVSLKGDLPLCEGDSQDFLLVSYYAPDKNFAVPQYAYDHDVDTITDETRSIELNVDIPPCWTQVDLVWGGEEELIETLVEDGPRYGDKKLGANGPPGNRSEGPKGWYNGPGTEGQKCTTPKAMFVDNCDGTVTVHLSNNGDDAKYDAKFTVKAGDFEEEVTVAPGEAAQVSVPAGVGEITVTEYDETTQTDKYVATHTWTRPEDCPPPTLVAESTCTEFILKISNPEGNQALDAVAKYGDEEKNVTIAPGTTEMVTFPAGDDDSIATVTIAGYEELAGLYEKPDNCDLPKTGASLTTYVAGGTGLMALGAVLFLFARRHLNRLRRLAA